MPTPRHRRILTEFAGDRRGSMIVPFALAALVLVMLVFGAIDVSRALTEKARLQDALDAATLYAALSDAETDAEIDAVGDRIFMAQLKDTGIAVDADTATFALNDNDAVTGTAEAAVKPFISSLFTNDNLPLKVSNTVMRGLGSKVELALVLDTTKSMEGAKLTALKTAATNLVTTLSEKSDDNLKIAVVPFADYVNIGLSRRNQPWVSAADYSTTTTTKGTCTTQKTKQVCDTQSYSCTKYADGVPYQSTCTKSVNCKTVALNPPVTTCTADKTTVTNYVFKGCVGSPAYPRNVRDDDTSRIYPGIYNATCAKEITPLTTTMSTVKSAITALTAAGNTYIPAGLAWGFNMLSSPVPMTEAEAYDATGKNLMPRKALVLMTDGQNSMKMNANGTHSSLSGGTAPTQADGYTAELCTNIKAKKIEVFTVAFQVTDPATKQMLQTCATDASHYFDASDSAALSKAFKDIADALRNVYIAK